jgi:asparagine synthetase B (glutamine-hydrolysing)
MLKKDILYYNYKEVPSLIKTHRNVLVPFLSEDFDDSLLETYNKLGLNSSNMVYDRSGILPHYLNIDKSNHLPAIKPFNKTFMEVCEERAKELLNQNKVIHVLWSGGLDSTFILFLLKYYSNDPDQVRVWGTFNSLIESGDLFDRRLKDEFKYRIEVPPPNVHSFNAIDCIFVSGMCANHLFGPTDDMFDTDGSMAFHYKLGNKDTIYESYEKHINPELLEFFDPMIKASHRKIETIYDLRWYCLFNLNWYTGLYDHKTMMHNEKAERIIPFFATDDFQLWSMTTNEPFIKVRGDSSTHRWQMREALRDLFGEEHYSKNKSKGTSVLQFTNQQWLFLLKNYQNILND